MVKTRLGSIVLACAAVDDVTAWCILAYVVALVRTAGQSMPLWGTLAASAAFALAMTTLVRRLLRRLEARFQRCGYVSDDAMAIILLSLLASATFTEYVGVHLLFGAFIFGAVMPKNEDFVQRVGERVQALTLVLLLPVFFAFTGLRTSVGLVRGAEMWWYCTLIVGVAVLGKLGGSALAARVGGLPWRDALSIGVFMNTRGLMELVVLNIGLDLGIVSPVLFSMMVLMAIVTTCFTAPLLDLLNRLPAPPAPTAAPPVLDRPR